MVTIIGNVSILKMCSTFNQYNAFEEDKAAAATRPDMLLNGAWRVNKEASLGVNHTIVFPTQRLNLPVVGLIGIQDTNQNHNPGQSESRKG